MEVLARADNSVAAERRQERLQRQIAALHAEAERRLADRSQALELEADRLEAQSRHLHHRAEAVVEREAALSLRQTEWENQQAQTEQDHEKQRQELQRLRRQAEVLTQYRKELKEEVDRLIQVMLEEADAATPVTRAA